MTSPQEQLATAAYNRLEDGSYHPDARRAAVAYYLEHGLAAAHQETGVPKQTLRHWLMAAGHDPAEVNTELTARTRGAAEASAAQVRRAVDQSLVSAEASAALVMRRGYAVLAQMLQGVRSPALDVMSPRDVIIATSRSIDDLARIRRATAGILTDPGERIDPDGGTTGPDGPPAAPVRPATLSELFGAPQEANAALAQVLHLHMRKGPARP